MMMFYSTVALVVILVATLTRYQMASLKFVLIFFSVFNAPFFYLREVIFQAARIYYDFCFYFDNEIRK